MQSAWSDSVRHFFNHRTLLLSATFSRIAAAAFCVITLFLPTPFAFGLGQPSYIQTNATSDGFTLFQKNSAAEICVDPSEFPGVLRATTNLQSDIQRVSNMRPKIVQATNQLPSRVILIGTIGKNRLLDQLIRKKKIDVSGVEGKWESFLIQAIPHPFSGVSNALVIAGSDKRGTIFGIYDLSEQIGVSPWYWWADVPVRHRDELFVRAGKFVEGPPAVKYRGIFLNDEAPALSGWAREKFGGLNHGFYTNVFELLLRLKANYLWPAMWNNSFATDDPLNAQLADEYGIVMSTSHHEPMMRAWKEWERAGHKKGSWDYSKNADALRDFWEEGVRRTKDYEKVITVGMRGDGDEPMSETDSISLLEKIVADQRQIISRVMNTNAESVPQVWALYKEVQGYYEKGMRVPDDVTLLWCDDNWGNLRRLPTAAERQRSGGAGIYYHFDYVGGPRNYKWLNTVPIPKVQEQMNLAYRYGADRLWIVNVGDLKPMEFPIEFFLTYARRPDQWPANRLTEYTRLWAEREFGPEHAEAIAEIVSRYTKFNGRRKPELLEPGTFSLENYDEADRVIGDWKAIVEKAETIYAALPKESSDAFYQLVLYPTKASAVVNELYVAVAKNRFYAEKNDERANRFAAQARELFQEDAELSSFYNHQLAGGKWNHMMDQTHIGYTGWQEPRSNVMPRVVEVTNSATGNSAIESYVEPANRESTSSKPPTDWRGFVESDGYVSIEAEHFTRKVDTKSIHWEILPDHGRTLSGVTIFPVTAPSVTPTKGSAHLEYQMWLSRTGAVEMTLILSPALNFMPDRGVRIGISFDDNDPQILTVVPQGYSAGDGNRDWEKSVKDSVRTVKSQQTLSTTGAHTLKIWSVDPAVVLQKILVDCGGLKPSYLGPPESFRTDF